MSRTTLIRLGLLGMVVAAAAYALPAAANHPPGPPATMTICHKPGTPAQQTMTLPHQAAASHIAAHGDTAGPCVPPPCAGAVDVCIDADGIASAGTGLPGAAEVTLGSALTSFPVTGGPPLSGLDMFDNDLNGAWTLGPAGDDLHSEDPGTCPTALRNAVHDLGLDCKVLDLDGGLANGAFVTCDVEFGIPFISACPANVRYNDVNANGVWNSGEDLVLDVNNDSIFN